MGPVWWRVFSVGTLGPVSSVALMGVVVGLCAGYRRYCGAQDWSERRSYLRRVAEAVFYGVSLAAGHALFPYVANMKDRFYGRSDLGYLRDLPPRAASSSMLAVVAWVPMEWSTRLLVGLASGVCRGGHRGKE
jgi:hypothetical protein